MTCDATDSLKAQVDDFHVIVAVKDKVKELIDQAYDAGVERGELRDVIADVMNGPVREGDRIAYPVRSGSYMWMVVGDVLWIDYRKTETLSGPVFKAELAVKPLIIDGQRAGNARMRRVTELERVVRL